MTLLKMICLKSKRGNQYLKIRVIEEFQRVNKKEGKRMNKDKAAGQLKHEKFRTSSFGLTSFIIK